MRDEVGLAGIDQALAKPGDDTDPFHRLPQDDGTRVGRQALRAALDAQGAVEIGASWSEILNHDASPWRWDGVLQLLPITLLRGASLSFVRESEARSYKVRDGSDAPTVVD